MAEKLAKAIHREIKQEEKSSFTLEAEAMVSINDEKTVLKVDIFLVKKLALPQLLKAVFFIPTRGFKVFHKFNQAVVTGCIKRVVEDYLKTLNKETLNELLFN